MLPLETLTHQMFTADQYQLIDFGNGRKLERFGDYILDRPAPVAERAKKLAPNDWKGAVARFDRGQANSGEWKLSRELPENWSIRHGSMTLQMRLTDSGQIGLFPEQAKNWAWIAKQVKKCEETPKVLNLFAYTAGATIAAAAAGAEVVHVDSASSVVAWARENAELSGLGDAPIRWICEDAVKFVEREVRRKNRYDAVVLDPPSYGHGPKGEVWKLSKDLMPLLSACRELMGGSPRFTLLSCHTPGYGPAELQACLLDSIFGHCSAGAKGQKMVLECADGRKLHSGASVRWPSV